MKKIRVLLILSAILFFIASVILYAVTTIMPTYDIEWRSILVMLSPARVLFAFSVVFLAFFALTYYIAKKQYNVKNLYKSFACILGVGLILAAVFAVKGYTSENTYWYMEEDKEHYAEIEKYLPYNNLFQQSDEDSEIYYQVLKASADSGIKHICANNIIKDSAHYEAEYFKSNDMLLNYKFIFDRTVPSISNDGFIDVEVEPFFGEKDGIKYSLYVQDDNYSLVIWNKSDVYYTYLLHIDSLDISTESFIETAIEQYHLMQNSAKLDVYDF